MDRNTAKRKVNTSPVVDGWQVNFHVLGLELGMNKGSLPLSRTPWCLPPFHLAEEFSRREKLGGGVPACWIMSQRTPDCSIESRHHCMVPVDSAKGGDVSVDIRAVGWEVWQLAVEAHDH